jgi:hypothetical protein
LVEEKLAEVESELNDKADKIGLNMTIEGEFDGVPGVMSGLYEATSYP